MPRVDIGRLSYKGMIFAVLEMIRMSMKASLPYTLNLIQHE